MLLPCEHKAQPLALVITVTDAGVRPPPDWQPAVSGQDQPHDNGGPAVADLAHSGEPDAARDPDGFAAVVDPDDPPDSGPRVDRPGPPARGLGLTIVRDVMARHGGRLVLLPRHPHGLVARLVFPQQAPRRAA